MSGRCILWVPFQYSADQLAYLCTRRDHVFRKNIRAASIGSANGWRISTCSWDWVPRACRGWVCFQTWGPALEFWSYHARFATPPEPALPLETLIAEPCF